MKTKHFLAMITLVALFLTNYHISIAQHASGEVHFENIEFEMPNIPEPVIPNNEVNIKDFGAVSGGAILNTQAFADAIEAVSKLGGGKVIIPPGLWLTGPIVLKSNLEIHAELGALIQFSANKDDYPLVQTSFEGLDTWRCQPPIFGKNLENVAFTGEGVYDGSGEVWRHVKRGKLTNGQWEKLVSSGGVVNKKGDIWYPSENYMNASENSDQNVRRDLKTKEDFIPLRDFLRPVLFNIQNSKNVMLDGPTFQNSPAWNLHPFVIENLIIRNITVRNPWFSQNGDGLDVESCKNVLVENSRFDVGDDAICIKSGKDEDGRKRGIPSENLVIRNNIVYHGHGGVVIGSEMSGGVKNMHVSNCSFMGTDVGLRFKSTRGRGGVVEDIYISDVYMTNIPTNAISFNLYYGGKSVAEMLADGDNNQKSNLMPVTEETPQFKNITIKNVELKGARQAVYVRGLPEMNVENMIFKNMVMEANEGFALTDVDGISIENVKLTTNSETGFAITNGKNIEIKDIEYNMSSPKSITVNGSVSENITLSASTKKGYKDYTTVGGEVSKKAVKF